MSFIIPYLILFDFLDPNEDQFAKLKKEKKERVAKNELQRLRNIARNMKGKGKQLSTFATYCRDPPLACALISINQAYVLSIVCW